MGAPRACVRPGDLTGNVQRIAQRAMVRASGVRRKKKTMSSSRRQETLSSCETGAKAGRDAIQRRSLVERSYGIVLQSSSTPIVVDRQTIYWM